MTADLLMKALSSNGFGNCGCYGNYNYTQCCMSIYTSCMYLCVHVIVVELYIMLL